mgnify:CR=1 FL=1
MIKQLVLQEICLECRGCCRFREAESSWTPSLLCEEAIAFQNKGIQPSFFSLEKKKILPIWNERNDAFLCPFVEEDTYHCQIYKSRPLECQLYPFVLSSRKEKIFLSVDLHCPYMEDLRGSTEIMEYAQYLELFFSSSQRKKILHENQHLIQPYEDVLDIIELL